VAEVRCCSHSEEGLSYIGSVQPLTVTTPTGTQYEGLDFDPTTLVAVSIVRAGDSMLDTFLSVAPEATVGKILIQRDEATAEPILFYSKMPSLRGKHVILLDPMLATGGSAKCAIQVLLDSGAAEEHITFLNVLSCPEGVTSIMTAFPKMRIVTGEIDPSLNEKVRVHCHNLHSVCTDLETNTAVYYSRSRRLRRQVLRHHWIMHEAY